MVPLSLRTFLPTLTLPLAIAGASAACGSDSVANVVYPGDDGGGGSGSGSGTASRSSSGIASGSSSATASGSNGDGGNGSSGGTASCDVSGYWLAVQHSVALSDGFKEIGHVYLYYDLSQNGDTVTVNHGLHCGLNVAKDPANLLGAGDSVSLPSAGPALLAGQDEGQAYGSQPARTGTMTMTSGGCQFHLNKYYVVRGATLPNYLNLSNTMSTSMPVAMGCGANFSDCQTPGSEDWDNDGKPGITLAVSGTATGNIDAAQRDYFGILRHRATRCSQVRSRCRRCVGQPCGRARAVCPRLRQRLQRHMRSIVYVG